MPDLLYETDQGVGYLTLNRPDHYNAVDLPMVDQLEQFWRDRRFDHEVRVIVISGGSAPGFCAGIDVKSLLPAFEKMTPEQSYDSQVRLSQLLLAMRVAPQPIVCCVHGAAAGLGFSLAMASDLRVVAEDARFCASYINIGFGGADMASSYFLPRLIGAGRANEYLLTGNWMSARDAIELGFASRLVPREQLLATGKELALTMAGKDPLGLRMTKEAINTNMDAGGLAAALQVEDRNQVMILLSKGRPC